MTARWVAATPLWCPDARCGRRACGRGVRAARLYPAALRLADRLVVRRQLDAAPSAAQHGAAVSQVGHEDAAAQQQRDDRGGSARECVASGSQRFVRRMQARALRVAGGEASALARRAPGCRAAARRCRSSRRDTDEARPCSAEEAAAPPMRTRACGRGRAGPAGRASGRASARTMAAGMSAGNPGWATMLCSRCSRAYSAAARPPWPSNTCAAGARSAAGAARERWRGRPTQANAHAPRRSRWARRRRRAPPRHPAPRTRPPGGAGRQSPPPNQRGHGARATAAKGDARIAVSRRGGRRRAHAERRNKGLEAHLLYRLHDADAR